VSGHVDAQVIMEFPEDVQQRRRGGDPLRYRETEPVSLSPAVVGILSQDDYLHIFKRCPVKSGKNLVPRQINHIGFLFFHEEILQVFKIGPVEFLHQPLFPAFMDPGVDHAGEFSMPVWKVKIKFRPLSSKK
jgi:hypothetical protein